MKLLILLLGFLAMNQHALATDGIIFKGHAHFKVKPAHVAAFKKEVEKIIAPTLKETGCISYEAYQIYDDKGRPTNEFVFHELWKSKEAMLVDHKDNTPHMQNFFAVIKIGKPDSYVESFEVSGHEVKTLNP